MPLIRRRLASLYTVATYVTTTACALSPYERTGVVIDGAMARSPLALLRCHNDVIDMASFDADNDIRCGYGIACCLRLR